LGKRSCTWVKESSAFRCVSAASNSDCWIDIYVRMRHRMRGSGSVMKHTTTSSHKRSAVSLTVRALYDVISVCEGSPEGN
jgi:hypothetical protein